jgi:hypothetical protein
MKHTCHWTGCSKEVPPAMWGCKTHWYRLPKWIRDRIWATYKPGQEITKTPSRAYAFTASMAQKWIELAEKYGDKLASDEMKKFIESKEST